MTSKNVVIVESPAKAKTINKYLGKDYQVFASFGHVRDLPAKDGSVSPDDDFNMIWEVDGKAAKRLNEIASAVKESDRLILATDPDREGEAISWHVLEVLKKKRALKSAKVQRVAFNAITREAISEAMSHPRDIDQPLVDAYLARRALDYLVGFNLSPVLWRKLPGSRSAGRVQSVALRLTCDREDEIEHFRSQEYWSVSAVLKNKDNEEFNVRLVAIDGRTLDKMEIGNEHQAQAYVEGIERSKFSVIKVESKPKKSHPQPPFTTSTLQQEASRKLNFSASHTMRVAQKLYEGISLGGETVGLITYMRTDGVQMAQSAIESTRRLIEKQFDQRYLPAKPRIYQSRAKNAQEAHEAIRPTDLWRTPDQVASRLDSDELKLYTLIWQRTVASQMESAIFDRTVAQIDAVSDAGLLGLRANGSVLTFPGYIALYREGMDDITDDEEGRLPPLQVGEIPTLKEVSGKQHFTEPPPRYTEATLIRKMEELGIGRPSTYTATLSTLRDRGYVTLDRKRLIPEAKGRIVTAFLKSFFSRYVEFDFTAELEQQLDQISNGDIAWRSVLSQFWKEFILKIEEVKEFRTAHILEELNKALENLIFPPGENGEDGRQCTACSDGRLSLKISRYGAFIGCSNYPDCSYTRQFGGKDQAQNADDASGGGDKLLGHDPDTGEAVYAKIGRFGPYVERGEGDQVKRANIPAAFRSTLDLDIALSLLALPRDVGTHPETGKPIVAGIGRYGPFVLHDGIYASLESIAEVFNVGLNRAVAALADKANKKGARSGASVPARNLGEFPNRGGEVSVKSGRYGPYVQHGKLNASIPKNMAPDAITLEQAVQLLIEREAKASSGTKKAAGKSKSTKKSKASSAPKRKTKT